MKIKIHRGYTLENSKYAPSGAWELRKGHSYVATLYPQDGFDWYLERYPKHKNAIKKSMAYIQVLEAME